MQSIHLPTLAMMAGRFRVAALWDIDEGLAARVAQGCDARVADSLDTLLADPEVEVVAICTPAALHADHIVAAMDAGKRVVLVEKPLATSREEAARIAEKAKATGTPLLVGAMHAFDPGWDAVRAEAKALATGANLLRSSIVLPYNSRFEQWAFEPAERDAQPSSPPAPDRRIAILNGGILQLLIHDLPLLRELLREGDAAPEVTAVRTFAPFGYAITARVGAQLVDLFAHVGDHWQARWSLEAHGREGFGSLDFPPSFVHAGAIGYAATGSDGTCAKPALPGDGYLGEWETIAALLDGSSPPEIPDIETIIRDLTFALDLRDQAVALVEAEGAPA